MLKTTERWTDMNNPYKYRNDNLLRLGFRSYQSYLGSPLWKSIRARVFERSQGRCERCRHNAATQVHHRAYDLATLRGETIDSLTATCAGCHKRAEFKRSKKDNDHGCRAYARFQRANEVFLRGKRVRRQPTDSARYNPKATRRSRNQRRAIAQLAKLLEWDAKDDGRLLEWANRV